MGNTLGIYFGPKLITIVAVKGKRIVNYVKIQRSALTESELEEKVPEDVKLVTLFGDELKKNKIEARETNICLSGKDLLVRTFELPPLPVNELPTAINFEAKKYIPFKVEDLVSDSQVELDKVSHRNMVLFLGIKKETLESYSTIFKQLNMKVASFDYSAFSIIRFLRLAGVGKKGIVGIISMDSQEEDEVNFTVIENGFPVFSRDITVNISPEEMAKPEEGGTSALLDKLKTEIRISLDYYHRKFPLKKLESVFLLTDENFRYDLEFFMKDMDLTAQYVDIYKYIGKAQSFSLSLLKGYGCALSRSVRTELKINLCKPKAKVKAIKRIPVEGEPVSIFSGLKLDYRVALIGILICAGVFGYGLKKILPVRSEVKNLIINRPKIEAISADANLEELSRRQDDFKNRIKVASDLIVQQLYFTLPLEVIPRSIPEDMWLTNFTLRRVGDTGIELSLSGFVSLENSDKELELVNGFAAKLKEDTTFAKYFKNVKILSVQQQQLGKINVTSFSINCN